MKSGISSLNPHAASYIPLSKRVPDSKSSSLEGINKGPGSSNSNTIFSDSPVHSGQGQYQKNSWLDSDVHEAERFPPSGNFASRSHPAHGSSSQNPTGFSDKQMSDMEFEMDMDYLQMSFPGLSQQSIADVYLANKGDLDSAFDMLNHLEFYPLEYPENLPESLDIGDVTEAGSSTEFGSLKMKNISDEAKANASSSTQ